MKVGNTSFTFPMDGVTLTVPIPSGATFVSVNDGACVYSAPNVVFSFGTLPANSSRNVSISLAVPATGGNTLSSTAVLTSTTGGETPSSITQTTTVEAGADSTNEESLDFTQRSHVASIDTIYDVRPWLSLGAKYGIRIGELRDSRVEGPWLSSRAQLFVVRADWHWVREWDMVVEGRRLEVVEAESTRTGVLAALYRHLGNNVKVGVGYTSPTSRMT